jgi:hypothetical protein
MPVARYCAFYCEENTWWRCSAAPQGRYAVFVSGLDRAVLMTGQKAGEGSAHIQIWDYHVFTIDDAGDIPRVYDPDHIAGEPVTLAAYLVASFPSLVPAAANLAPLFRVIPATKFIEVFASDRSHMLDDDGNWRAPPPPWPCIGEGMNLPRFKDLSQPFEGDRLDLEGLRQRFVA